MYYFIQYTTILIIIVLNVTGAKVDVAATQTAQDKEQSHGAHQVGKFCAPTDSTPHLVLATLVLGDIRGVVVESGLKSLGRHVQGSTQTDHHTNRNAHHLAVHD